MSTTTVIADRIEIADLFARFALLLDEKRWDDADTVFTDDVTAHSPRSGEVHGLDTLVGFMRRAGADGERTQHLTTDLLVDVDGDRAAASANSLVHFSRDGGAPHLSSGLRVVCTVVRTPAGWRIRESRTVVIWTRQE
ncbi:nuclear transport factor 2 family protein [Streptomyces sp. NPDC088261]|uniref:nuclear transport factor 2 family protein n=1 Tax=Streptomyces sp. NPDC088261 TaxID=3365851 RepID=UPI003826025B